MHPNAGIALEIDEMPSRGHVFVLQGNLLRLSCNEVLVPTDFNKRVERYWGRWWRSPREFPPWADDDSRVTEPVVVDGQLVRYAAIGTTRDQADAELLKQVVQTGLAACVQDAVRMQDSPEVAHRAKWLVAIPLFGTRAGGFDAVRGEALKAVLAAAKWAADQGIDVAIVCCEHRSRSAARAGR